VLAGKSLRKLTLETEKAIFDAYMSGTPAVRLAQCMASPGRRSPRRCGATRPCDWRPRADMIRIAISQAAFEAIAATLPVGSTGYENAVNEKGERLIWLERRMLDKLNSYRRAGESTSDLILRVAAEDA
jgi:hypothetical protein